MTREASRFLTRVARDWALAVAAVAAIAATLVAVDAVRMTVSATGAALLAVLVFAGASIGIFLAVRIGRD